jgi:hypothetical protein
MVLLELLRGSIGSITAANIDLIIGENSAVVTDSSETKHEEDGHRIERTESRVRRESTAHAEQELSADAAKLRFKKAHQFCKAVAPRRIKDFSHYKDGSGDYKWQMDNDGNQVWRLRKVGDPDNINIRTRHAPNPASEVQSTGTRPYHFACPIMESHWQLADFGIGVGLYYTMLAVWMGFLGLLFLINVPAMMCNAEFKKTMNVYKGCRNMTLNNAAGNTFPQYTQMMNGSALGVAQCAGSLGMVENPIAGIERSLDAIPSFCKFLVGSRGFSWVLVGSRWFSWVLVGSRWFSLFCVTRPVFERVVNVVCGLSTNTHHLFVFVLFVLFVLFMSFNFVQFCSFCSWCSICSFFDRLLFMCRPV